MAERGGRRGEKQKRGGREREREREREEKEKLATQQKKLALCGALIKASCNQKSTSGGPFAPHPPTPSDCEMVCLIVTSYEPFSGGELDMPAVRMQRRTARVLKTDAHSRLELRGCSGHRVRSSAAT